MKKAEGITFYFERASGPDRASGPVPGTSLEDQGMPPGNPGFNNMPDRDSMNPSSAKVIPENLKYAATMGEILQQTSPSIVGKASGVPLRVLKFSPATGLWMFQAQGSKGEVYKIRIKGVRKGTTKKLGKLQVKVSCTCPFWQWQGPEHWAKANGFLYGKPAGTAAKPDAKDPSGKHWCCKHVAAALAQARTYELSAPRKKMGGWTFGACRFARVPRSDPAPSLARGIQKRLDTWVRQNGPVRFKKEMALGYWKPDITYETWLDFQSRPTIRFEKDQIEIKLDPAHWSSKHLSDLIPIYAVRRGWFVKSTSNTHSTRTFTLESRRGERVDPPKVLWHATSTNKVRSIFRKGLLPRSRSRDDESSYVQERKYPDRVYLSKSRADAEQIAHLLWERDTHADTDIESWYAGDFHVDPYVLIRVDTGKLKPGTKFYEDPDFRKGVYTLTPIPPAALTLAPNTSLLG